MHKPHEVRELNDALEHIVYEIWKYKQSVDLYGPIQIAGGDAALEFRVLHHRVLLEFLYGPAKHKDNIVAWEYVPDWLAAHDPDKVPWLDSYLKRCHTMLAHISTTRTQIAKAGLKSWSTDWQTVEPHLDRVVADFLHRLSPQFKSHCLSKIDSWLAMRCHASQSLRSVAAMISL